MGDDAAATLVYLHPGDLAVSAQPLRISTILGPCVAVCLWDPDARVGGMNHVVLPQRLGGVPVLTKLAGPGTRELVERVCALGALRGNLRAHVFGGARIADGGFGRGVALGERNVLVVQETLRSCGIPVIGEDVGGPRGRKVVFCTATGRAQVALL